jgi:hypothetical protein
VAQFSERALDRIEQRIFDDGVFERRLFFLVEVIIAIRVKIENAFLRHVLVRIPLIPDFPVMVRNRPALKLLRAEKMDDRPV